MKTKMVLIIIALLALAGSAYCADLFESCVTYPAGSWPEAVAIGDVNGDGRNDVVMVTSYYFDPNNDFHLFIYLQDGSGNLEPPIKYLTSGTTIGTRPQTVALGDLNNDGRLDIVVGNLRKNIEVFIQDAFGGFDESVKFPTLDSDKVRIADLNHDGLIDVVGIGWGRGTASILLQQPDGSLGKLTKYPLLHGGYEDLDVGDVNGDGLTDIIVVSGSGVATRTLGVLPQQPNGTFGDAVYYGMGKDTMGNMITGDGVAVGDVNGDNLPDVVVTFDGHIDMFRQDTSGKLSLPQTYRLANLYPEPVEIADVNSDGRKDVISVYSNVLIVLPQGSDGSLGPEESYEIHTASHYNPHGLAVGDINGDGLNDVVVANSVYGLEVLYHQPPYVLPPKTPLAKGVTSEEIEVTWQDNSTNAAGFGIERKTGDCSSEGGWSQVTSVDKKVTSYTDHNLLPGTSYSYRVVAFNSSYSSPYSACVSEKTAYAGTPPSPSDLTAIAVTPDRINLSWKDLSMNETEFKIYRRTNGGSWMLLNSVPANAISYFDITAFGNNNKTVYSYYVIACNDSGCSNKTSVAIVQFVPSNLVANSLYPFETNLKWKDNSGNETGFLIYRKEGTCYSAGNWESLGYTGKNVTEYSDAVKKYGVTYAYMVSAIHISSSAPYSYGISLSSGCAAPQADANLFHPYTASWHDGSRPEAVAIGDINGDGRNDVAMLASLNAKAYHFLLYLQNETGELQEPVKYYTDGNSESLALGDVNHDGIMDVVAGNSAKNIEVFTGISSDGFNPSVKYETLDSYRIGVGDFNHDGLLDVAGIGKNTNTMSVLLQKPDGTLAAPAVYQVSHGGYGYIDMSAGDVNGDGLTDIVILDSTKSSIGVLLQNKDGSMNHVVFHDMPYIPPSGGVGTGDINGDGKDDIVATLSGQWPNSVIAVFRQNSVGSLDLGLHLSSDIPGPVVLADVNGDGKKDIVVAHNGWNELGIYLQNADGTLAPEQVYFIPYASYSNRGIAVGDINGDGANDVVLADSNQGLVVIRNQAVSTPTPFAAGTVAPDSIMLSWKDNSRNESGFRIERKPGSCASSSVWTEIAHKAANTMHYLDAGLVQDKWYSYRVSAFNEEGSIAYSQCVSSRTAKEGTPKSPSSLTARSVSANQINLSWKDNSNNETRFEVYRRIKSKAWSLLATTDADSIKYLDKTAEGNAATSPYSYYVVACNKIGCSSFTNMATVPLQADNLTVASITSDSVKLTWSDMSIGKAGYLVNRKKGRCSSPDIWSLAGRLEPGASSFEDNGLVPGLIYSYEVMSIVNSFSYPQTHGMALWSMCVEVQVP